MISQSLTRQNVQNTNEPLPLKSNRETTPTLISRRVTRVTFGPWLNQNLNM